MKLKRTFAIAKHAARSTTKVAAKPAVLAALAATALAGLLCAQVSPASGLGLVTRSYRTVSACAKPAAPNFASCFALRRQTILGGHAIATLLKSRGDSAKVNGDAGFGATALRKAYDLHALGSRARVIAIVDATHSGTAFDDLSEYRKTFGLPAMTDCTKKAAARMALPSGVNPCFIQVTQTGQPSQSAATEDSGWAQETALDLAMASAACPKCSLLLVEGASASFDDLAAAVGLASSFTGVRAISNSYGGSDSSAASFGQYAAAALAGIAVTASSGDFGFGVESPASFDGVIAVGGTSLQVDANGNWLGETAWSGSGSGCSAFNPQPIWQQGAATRCAGKVTADVAAVADPATGVSVFYNGGWYVFGGTSASAPFIAGIYALKNDFGADAGSFTATNADRLHDIVVGTNASGAAVKRACKITLWCNAGPGFDGPTGFGSPWGAAAF